MNNIIRIALFALPVLLACLTGCDGAASTADEHGRTDAQDHDHGEAESHADEVTLTPEAIERWGVRVEPARKQALRPVLHAPARVTFNEERIAHVGSVVAGRISEVRVRIGDRVAAGDPLLVVASPELGEAQSDFLLKQTAIVTGRAALDMAESLHRSARSLYDQTQGIALSEVQRREAELKAAQGALRAAEGSATAAENTLHLLGMDQAAVEQLAQTGEISPSFTIRAAIPGEVVERRATLGESVGPDRDALLVIADLDTLWVLAEVPESDAALLHVGDTAIVRLPSLGDREIRGKVGYVSPRLSTATRTIPVRIEINAQDTGLLPGMFVEVELHCERHAAGETILAIPEQAVQTVEGDAAVFVPVAGEPGTFAKRAVRIGEPVGGLVPVLDGLTEGEPYVASGSFILKADLGKAGAGHDH